MNNQVTKDCSKDAIKNNNKTTKQIKKVYKNGKSKDRNRGIQSDSPSMYKQDPFWYAQDQAQIDNMGSVPFLTAFGEGIPVANGVGMVPGLAIAWFEPCICADIQSPNNYATRAAHAYYQYVTQGFTGGVDFEAPDLLMATIAGAQVIMAMKAVRKVLGLSHYYLQMNKIYAETVVSALGINYSDLVKNYRNYIARYNIMVSQISKVIAVPKQFFISDRWDFLADNCFTDSADPSYSTLYTWMPRYFLTYFPVATETGTSLLRNSLFQPTTKITDASTLETVLNRIDMAIRRLTDDDVRSMFGAIRRVYSDNQFKTLDYMAEDYFTPVLQHDVVAMQFHNLEAISFPKKSGLADIPAVTYINHQGEEFVTDEDVIRVYQDENGQIGDTMYVTSESACVYNPIDGIPSSVDNHILDLYDHLVNPGNVLDATATKLTVSKSPRFTYTYPQSTTEISAYKLYFRSEVCIGIQLIVPNQDTLDYLTYIIGSCTNSTGLNDQALAALTKIDAHPLTGRWNSEFNQFLGLFGELNHYTMISRDVLTDMHEKSQFTLLMLPENSKSITK